MSTDAGTTAAFIFANDTFLAAQGQTEEEAQADYDSLVERNEIDDSDESVIGPVLAIVRKYGRAWEVCEAFYRIRNIGVTGADAYQVGPEPGANWFTSKTEAVEAAKELDEIDDFDVEVVEFTSPRDSGRVIWGY